MAHLIDYYSCNPVCGAKPFQELGVSNWERFMQLHIRCPDCERAVIRTYGKERLEVYFGIRP